MCSPITNTCLFLTGKWNQSGMNIIAFATYFHFPASLHFPTCKVVLWSENGELKKVVTILITISVTYFSNMESACFLSLVLLQACKDNLFLGQKQLSHGRLISVTDWNSWFRTVPVTAIPCQNDIYDTWISGFPAYTKAEAQHRYCSNVLAYSMFRREGKKKTECLRGKKVVGQGGLRCNAFVWGNTWNPRQKAIWPNKCQAWKKFVLTCQKSLTVAQEGAHCPGQNKQARWQNRKTH